MYRAESIDMRSKDAEGHVARSMLQSVKVLADGNVNAGHGV